MDKSSKITLAFADDNDRYRNGFANVLNMAFPDRFHFQITASNGEELLDKLTRETAKPDIVLLDINMPILNGYKTISRIREQWPEQKVVCLSLFNDEYAIIKMIVHGVDGYLVKDIDAREAGTAIISIYNGERYFAGVPDKFSLLPVEELAKLAPNLTEKEMKFLELCASEKKYDEMAEELGLSIRTVHSYRDIIFKKFGLNTRAGLALFANRIGLAPSSNTNQGKYFK